MKLGVAVPKIKTRDITANTLVALDYIHQAGAAGVDLLLLPETMLTGFVFDDIHAMDLPHAVAITDAPIIQLCEAARTHDIWVAFGFIENNDEVLFDSAVLINNKGEIVLHQRRLTRGWCASNANPAEYGSGATYHTAMTPWGKVGFMICGDLFDAVHHATDAALDILLFPYARCFVECPGSQAPHAIQLGNGVADAQRQWDDVEWPDYAAQIKKANAGFTLGANYISADGDDDYFGGGFITGRDGVALATLPLFTPGLLTYEVPPCK